MNRILPDQVTGVKDIIPNWNNARERTQAEVVEAFRGTAKAIREGRLEVRP